MFTRSDLDELMADDSAVTVSFYLPTQVRGAETREGPIRLKNLVAQATAALAEKGLSGAAAAAFLQPAQDLVEDALFWQHRDLGLAVFLGSHDARVYSVPLPLDEQVVVGQSFQVRGLLPLLAVEGHFRVLTLTEDQAQVFQASRYAMTQVTRPGLPAGPRSGTDASDYENPVQASPVARPHTGTANISNAQVYGDSPPEWRKKHLLEYARTVAADLDDLDATDPAPVVLVANPELAGHLQKLANLGDNLAAVIDTNPAALSAEQLHQLAYQAISGRLDQARLDAVEEFSTLQGQRSPRAVDDPFEIMQLAHEGRLQTLLLEEPDRLPADGEPMTYLLEAAVTSTLSHGGAVHLVSPSDLDRTSTAAVLRY